MAAVQRLVVAVVERRRVHHVVRPDSAEPDQGNAGACGVIGAVVGEILRDHDPAVLGLELRHALLQQTECVHRALQALRGSRIDLRDVEVLARLDAQRLQLLDHRAICGSRRVVLHQPRQPPEESAGVHPLHLRGRRRLRVDAGDHRHLGRRHVGLAPSRQRRQLVLLLQRIDDVVVLRAVGLHLPVDPHEARRRTEGLLDVGGRRALSSRARRSGSSPPQFRCCACRSK